MPPELTRQDPDNCPKCGAFDLKGPTYHYPDQWCACRPDSAYPAMIVKGVEHLSFKCQDCGYQLARPTLDNLPDELPPAAA